MNLVTSFPKYSDGELNRAFMQEIKSGFQLERAMEQKREIQAAHEAKIAREMGNKNKAIGNLVATIPERDFFRLVQKYGHAETHSKEFVRYLQKKMPHLAGAKI